MIPAKVTSPERVRACCGEWDGVAMCGSFRSFAPLRASIVVAARLPGNGAGQCMRERAGTPRSRRCGAACRPRSGSRCRELLQRAPRLRLLVARQVDAMRGQERPPARGDLERLARRAFRGELQYP